MISVGIDVGTMSIGIFSLKDERPYVVKEFKTREIGKRPEILLETVKELNPDVIAGISGYGLPVKSFSDLNDEDLFLMTLNLDRSVLGVRKIMEAFRRDPIGSKAFTIPAVIHLKTVPDYRKINRIDMGTSDKLCSVALALFQLKKSGIDYRDQNFVLVEAGYGFNSFIAVKNGKVVDGIGGTSGFPSFSSIGAIDGELAYLLDVFSKDLLFKGGISSYLKDIGIHTDRIEEIPDFALKWLFEYILKGIRAISVSLDDEYIVVLSGRFFERFYEEFLDYSGLDALMLNGFGVGKQSAQGACIIANGLADGIFREIVEWLEIRNAGGTILDYITSDFRRHLRIRI